MVATGAHMAFLATSGLIAAFFACAGKSSFFGQKWPGMGKWLFRAFAWPQKGAVFESLGHFLVVLVHVLVRTFWGELL